MRLINCRTCDRKVSENADSCPGCGNTDPAGKKAKARMFQRMFGALVVIVALSYLWFVQIPEIRRHGFFPQTLQK